MADPRPYPGTPRWVKVFGITVGGLILLAVVLLHAGGSPRHKIPAGDAVGRDPPSSVTEDATRFGDDVNGDTAPKSSR